MDVGEADSVAVGVAVGVVVVVAVGGGVVVVVAVGVAVGGGVVVAGVVAGGVGVVGAVVVVVAVGVAMKKPERITDKDSALAIVKDLAKMQVRTCYVTRPILFVDMPLTTAELVIRARRLLKEDK